MKENNVRPLELAILVGAKHYQNKDRICQVIARMALAQGDDGRVWWICEFPRPVKTTLGWMYFSCIEDKNLQRLSERVQRFSYHRSHYSLLPALANASCPTDAQA